MSVVAVNGQGAATGGGQASSSTCRNSTVSVSVSKGRRSRRRRRGGRKMEAQAAQAVGGDDIDASKLAMERLRKEEEAGGGGGRYELLSYEELPEYMKENEYILGHYRAEWPLKQALLSLFRWHNETLDVWTHLIAFMVFLGLTIMHLRDVPAVSYLLNNFSWPIAMTAAENVSGNPSNFHNMASFIKLEGVRSSLFADKLPLAAAAAPRWPFFVFLGGSMYCLLSSSICHLFCCHSHRFNILLLRFDYVGIAVMIITSFFPPIYYIFQCEPHWQITYLGGITIMGCFTIFTLLSPHLSRGSFRTFRALLFLAMGFSGIVPAIHATIVNWDEPQRPITLAYESAMAMLYVTGTLFYVSRVPERWKPGFFDLTGHSHQIFHVFVVAGALAHYGAALVLLEWRDRVGCA